jgi:hypothetical protein
MKPTHRYDTKACPGGPTVSIAFWSKLSPVDFNRDVAACLIFIPCTTSPAIFNAVFGPAKRKKDQTSADQATEHFE